ncbi:MAG: hypothetical protein V4643_06635, partial [Bacteroidota bacterium]
LNNKTYSFRELISYNFDKTNYIYKCDLIFKNETINLNILIKVPGDYLQFKKAINQRIDKLNKERNSDIKIQIKNWYNSKFAKFYGYFIILLLLSWFIAMLFKVGHFTWSNFALFIVIIAGCIPIIVRIFIKKK